MEWWKPVATIVRLAWVPTRTGARRLVPARTVNHAARHGVRGQTRSHGDAALGCGDRGARSGGAGAVVGRRARLARPVRGRRRLVASRPTTRRCRSCSSSRCDRRQDAGEEPHPPRPRVARRPRRRPRPWPGCAPPARPTPTSASTTPPWVVLADPEGNEFCVLDPRDRYAGRARAGRDRARRQRSRAARRVLDRGDRAGRSATVATTASRCTAPVTGRPTSTSSASRAEDGEGPRPPRRAPAAGRRPGAPRWRASRRSARRRPTSARVPTSRGWCSPIPRATSSACCGRSDRPARACQIAT